VAARRAPRARYLAQPNQAHAAALRCWRGSCPKRERHGQPKATASKPHDPCAAGSPSQPGCPRTHGFFAESTRLSALRLHEPVATALPCAPAGTPPDRHNRRFLNDPRKRTDTMKSLKIPLICLLASASLGLPLTACDGEVVGFPDTDTVAPAVSATTPINGAVAHVGSRHVGSRLPRAPSLCQTGGSGAARHRARNGRLCFRGLFAGSGFGLLTVRQAKLRSGGCHVSPYSAET
jgi:hypothetical protein